MSLSLKIKYYTNSKSHYNFRTSEQSNDPTSNAGSLTLTRALPTPSRTGTNVTSQCSPLSIFHMLKVSKALRKPNPEVN